MCSLPEWHIRPDKTNHGAPAAWSLFLDSGTLSCCLSSAQMRLLWCCLVLTAGLWQWCLCFSIKVLLLSVTSAPFSTISFLPFISPWRFLDTAKSSRFFNCELWYRTLLVQDVSDGLLDNSQVRSLIHDAAVSWTKLEPFKSSKNFCSCWSSLCNQRLTPWIKDSCDRAFAPRHYSISYVWNQIDFF